jgi:hypothetical protein
MIVFFILSWVFELPQMDPKRYTKTCKWARCKSQHLSLKINP